MGLIKEFSHQQVKGARFGKYNIADNSTAVIYRLGSTLIDSGPSNQCLDITGYLAEKNFDKLILTHHHEDHSGNAAAISKKFKIPVYAHESGISDLEKGFSLKLYQKIFWGRADTFKAEPLMPLIDTGTGLFLKPVHTPGHSHDHVCFLEEKNKWLFTGDLFLSPKPRFFRIDENLELQIRSLEKILSYDFEIVFCSHSGIVENGYSLIEKKLIYFKELVKKVKKMSSDGLSINKISDKIFGRKDLEGLLSFNHICKKNLVKECIRLSGDLKLNL